MKAPLGLHTTNEAEPQQSRTGDLLLDDPERRSEKGTGEVGGISETRASLDRFCQTTEGAPMRPQTKRTYRIDTTTIIAVALLLAAFAAIPARSEASYRPAPASVVRAALGHYAPRRGTIEKRAWVICRVFPRSSCIDALNVAYCESTIRTWVANGQYLGAFQMGSGERARFGHGSSIWQQAPAARRYWALSGWHPWECHP